MVVIEIRGMVGDHGVGFRLHHGLFNKLHQLQMGHGVHFNIGEISQDHPVHAQGFHAAHHIRVKLTVLRTESPGRRLGAHNTDIYLFTLLGQPVNRRTGAQNLVIRMGHNHQIGHT